MKAIIENDPIPLPKSTDPLFRRLIEKMLVKNPNLWASIEEVMKELRPKEDLESVEEEKKMASPKKGFKPKKHLYLDHGFSDEEQDLENEVSKYC